jgi:hypothetical protein
VGEDEKRRGKHIKQKALCRIFPRYVLMLFPPSLSFPSGNMSRHPKDACARFHFDPDPGGFRHLIADQTSEECPFHGRFHDRNEGTQILNHLIPFIIHYV